MILLFISNFFGCYLSVSSPPDMLKIYLRVFNKKDLDFKISLTPNPDVADFSMKM